MTAIPARPTLLRAIGNQTRKARIAAQLSQGELAAAIGMSRAAVCNIENGVHSTSIATFYRIAEWCDVCVYELLPEKEPYP